VRGGAVPLGHAWAVSISIPRRRDPQPRFFLLRVAVLLTHDLGLPGRALGCAIGLALGALATLAVAL
jgi:hypothetical protein